MVLSIPAILAILGLFCGYFAAVSGRDPYRWFLGGTVTGTLGLLVLCMLPPRKAETDTSPVCPACGRDVHIDDMFCRYCGAQVGNHTPQTASDSQLHE